jgi:hypothetical protein
MIYDAIADRQIVMPDSSAIGAWHLVDVKNQVVSDHLPVRLILPPGSDGRSAVESVDVQTRTRFSVVWRVTDLLLYRAVGRTGAVGNVYGDLTDYIDVYIKSMMANKTVAPGAQIIDFNPVASVLEWPQGSGSLYHGVQMTVFVREQKC